VFQSNLILSSIEHLLLNSQIQLKMVNGSYSLKVLWFFKTMYHQERKQWTTAAM